jgi:serine/threonine protein phosphatase 1
MTAKLAFIGDVHGGLDRLSLVLEHLDGSDRTTVLLGDYVNVGPDAAGVLDLLVERKRDLGDRLVLLAGNHDLAFLDFLRGGDLAPLLAMGGATTVTSYLGSPAGEVTAQLRRAVPSSHRRLLEQLGSTWRGEQVMAMHKWPLHRVDVDGLFVVLGHYFQERRVPSINTSVAYIDTGCGSYPDGVLTCLLMPERDWFSC